MLLLSDNDVIGAVQVLRRVLESDEWREYARLVGVEFTDFASHALPRDASDRVVWETSQAIEAVLLTGNRAGGNDSLDEVIAASAGPTTLPVITLADPQRVMSDGEYAYRTAVQLLDYLDRMEQLRGTGRSLSHELFTIPSRQLSKRP